MRYEKIFTPEEASARMIQGNATVYNTKTGIVLIPDIVDGADRENEEYGFRAGNGDWLYGMMGAIVPPDIAKPIIDANESLDDYTLGHYPAPGTGAKDRMMQLSADSAEEIKEMFLEFFKDAPEGWVSESVCQEQASTEPEKLHSETPKPEEDTVEVNVFASPYANCYGTIRIPKGTADVKNYVAEHFNDIKFGEPELDFCGVDIEI